MRLDRHTVRYLDCVRALNHELFRGSTARVHYSTGWLVDCGLESGAYRFRVYVKDPELIKITFLILLEKLRDTHGQKGTTINVAVNPLKFKPE